MLREKYSIASPWYHPGRSYGLIVHTSVGETTTSLIAPGGVKVNSKGDGVKWRFDGKNDYFFVDWKKDEYTDSIVFQSPLGIGVNSLCKIPVSIYSKAGNYFLGATAISESDEFKNAALGSSFVLAQHVFEKVRVINKRGKL